MNSKYFEPVAGLPGFARALARTLARIAARRGHAGSGSPARALAVIWGFCLPIPGGTCSDGPWRIWLRFSTGGEAAENGRSPLMGLPLLLLDVPLETRPIGNFRRNLSRERRKCWRW